MKKHLTILLVEDNPNDVVLVKMALKRNDIANPVHVVNDGVEAVDYLRHRRPSENEGDCPLPSVIFLDLKMPRMNGFEVLEWLREQPNLTVIPTIVLTSSKDDGDVQRAYSLGANSFMVKPMTFEELLEVIKIACEYWRCCEVPKISSD